MRGRLVMAVALAVGVVLAGAIGARAGTAEERIARQRADVKAQIACTRARIDGRSCDRPAAPQATTRSRQDRSGAGARRIEISIGEQMLRAYEAGRVVIQTPVSTGAPRTETPTGRYAIQSKETMHWSTRYSVWMPYAMRVVGGIFIHELPLTPGRTRIGASSLGRPVSHGCIRVGVGTAERLFAWASVGTPVLIG